MGVAGGCVVALAAGVLVGAAGLEVGAGEDVTAGEAVVVAVTVGVGFGSPPERHATAPNIDATAASRRTPYSTRPNITCTSIASPGHGYDGQTGARAGAEVAGLEPRSLGVALERGNDLVRRLRAEAEEAAFNAHGGVVLDGFL